MEKQALAEIMAKIMALPADRVAQVEAFVDFVAAEAAEDAGDTAIAHQRIAEISADPGSVISGAELDKRLREWLAE
jgi:hypothetical protein